MNLKPVGSGSLPVGAHRPFYPELIPDLLFLFSRFAPTGVEKSDVALDSGRVRLFPQQTDAAAAPSPGQFFDLGSGAPSLPLQNTTAIPAPAPEPVAQLPEQTPAPEPASERQPDVFDRLRDVYREYYPEDSKESASKEDSLVKAVSCGWKMADVIPHGKQILTAGAALGLLLLFFAFRRKRVIVNVIHPEDPAAAKAMRDRFAKGSAAMKQLYNQAQYSPGKGAQVWKG